MSEPNQPLISSSRVRPSAYLRRAFEFEGVIKDAEAALATVNYDTLVCTGTSGIVAASVLAMRLNKKLCVVRKEADGSHTNHSLEGYLGERWVLVDDFVATGATLVRVLETLCLYDSSCAGALLYARLSDSLLGAAGETGKFIDREGLGALPCGLAEQGKVRRLLADHAVALVQAQTRRAELGEAPVPDYYSMCAKVIAQSPQVPAATDLKVRAIPEYQILSEWMSIGDYYTRTYPQVPQVTDLKDEVIRIADGSRITADDRKAWLSVNERGVDRMVPIKPFEDVPAGTIGNVPPNHVQRTAGSIRIGGAAGFDPKRYAKQYCVDASMTTEAIQDFNHNELADPAVRATLLKIADRINGGPFHDLPRVRDSAERGAADCYKRPILYD